MKRKGYLLLELMMAIALIASLTAVYIRYMAMSKQNNDLLVEKQNAEKLADGIFRNYLVLYSYHLPLCEPNGWDNPNCQGLTLFPTYDNATSSLIYYDSALTTGSLTTDQINALVSQLASNLYPACVPDPSYSSPVVGVNGNMIIFKCYNPRVYHVIYGLSDGTKKVDSYLAPGTSINPFSFPVLIYVNYEREYTYSGVKRPETVAVDGGWLYQRLLNESRTRLRKIATAMKTYAKTRLTTEMELQGYPNGLHSIDDYYVPWIWEALYSPNPSLTSAYTRCTDSNCTSIVADPNGWVNTSFDYNFVLNRLVRNLVAKTYTGSITPYWSDAFLNQIKIIPIGNGCDFSDLSTCDPYNNMPPKPQQNYSAVYNVKPPFVSYIFVSPCADLPETDFCKIKVIYDN